MTFAPINHRAGILELAPPFWGLPRVAAFLQSLLAQLQEVEDTFWAIETARDLATCDLVRLKILGTVVGEKRWGRALEAYRDGVRGRIRANISKGSILDLRELWTLLTEETTDLIMSVWPAAVLIVQDSARNLHVWSTSRLLRATASAGVEVLWLRPQSEGCHDLIPCDFNDPSGDPDNCPVDFNDPGTTQGCPRRGVFL